MKKLKINFLGTGIEIKRILLPDATLEKWKGLLGQNKQLPDALLDPFFYYKLKDRLYASLEDLPAEKCSGILNTPKSQIEFWFDRKKVYKVQPHELFNDNVLFPLFTIEKAYSSFTASKGIYILQKEIGTLGTYELIVNSETLNIDDFVFETDSYGNDTFVKNITYQNQNLVLVKKDTVITYQSGFER